MRVVQKNADISLRKPTRDGEVKLPLISILQWLTFNIHSDQRTMVAMSQEMTKPFVHTDIDIVQRPS